MKGAIKKGWKKLLVLAMTCVFSASTMGGLYRSYSEAAETLRGKDGSASASASADGEQVAVQKMTNISDVSLSSEYVLNAEGETAGTMYDDNDIVTVIVKLKDESMLSKATYDAGMNVDEYALTEEGIRYNLELQKSRDGFIRSNSAKLLSVGYEYSTIFNGFAADIYYKSLSALENDPNVESVLISEKYDKPQVVTENDVNVYETGIYDSSDIDYDGSGTVVAVLDTGLDYTHTAFQNQPTGDLALTMDDVNAVFDDLAAKQLDAANENNVRDLRAEDLYYSDKVPFMYDYADSDSNVYPVNDHGTHVAGVIAGKDDVITGVATQAQLAIFKVFGNEDEGAPQEAILAALNDAILLGVDAINMSLGSSCGFSRATDEDATNEIYDAIKESGICLIVAASNSYSSAQGSTNGDTNLASNPDSATIGSPSTYDAAISVASISGVKSKYFVADGTEEIYFTEGALLNGDTKDFVGELLGGQTEATFEYVVVPGIGGDNNYTGIDVEGKIAVVRRGSNTFEEKIDAAERNGAAGVIIYNNVSGVISMSVGDAKIPACSIQMDYGNYLAEQGSGTMHFSTEYLAGPFMSNFSSWGPKAELELSPDITAHGGEIYSAVRGGYDTYSGTSMASPNMAGATILVREYVKQNYPELSNYEITELTYQLMMSTATIARNEVGNPYSPRKQGAGLADIASAIDTKAYLYVPGQNKTKLSLGDDVDKTGVYTLTFNLKNLSGQAVSYRIDPIVMTESMSSDDMTVAEMAYLFEDASYEYSVENGTVSGDVVSVGGYGECVITVKITLSQADKDYLDEHFVNGMYVEGYVRLLSLNADGIGLNIPYLAFYGDWTQAPLLDVTAYEVGASQEDDSVLEEDKLEPDVYATVPMGGFRYAVSSDEYEETYYYLGGFGYTLADVYEMPAIIEDKAAISNNMDATYSLYCISAGLLRNAKYAKMQIVDSLTGEVVFSKVSENNRKSYSNGGSQVGGYVDVGFYVNEYNLENNRKYTYSMVCYLDYDEHEQHNLKNTFSFSFYIDNEAPTMVEEDTRIRVNTNSNGDITSRSLNMYVYDNHYIQGYFIYTYSSISADGTVNDQEALIDGCIPVDGERNTTTAVSLNITNIYNDILKKGGKVMVEFIDYAKNRSTYTIDLNTLAKPVTDIQLSNENRDSYTLRINRQINLNTFIDVTPENTYVEDLIWTSSDPEVAEVKDGLVTGLKAGTAVITVTNAAGNASVQITITVSETGGSDSVTLSALELNTNAVTLERGESYELTVGLKPYNFVPPDDFRLNWNSTSTYFRVDVSEDGMSATITALESGSGSIMVSASGISARCQVTVEEEYEMEGHYLRSYTGRGDENGVVEIPDDLGITYIYRYAFYGNDYITKIILPEGLEVIEEAAIYACENLEEVVFPDSVTQIGRFALGWNPSLKTVTGTIPTIGDFAFYNCPSLENIDLSGTMFIGESAFVGAEALTSVDLSNTVYVGPSAFALCSGLTDVVTSGNTVIGSFAFQQCTGLTDLEINSAKIGTYAFYGCTSLESVTFNNAVETIDDAAFYNCVYLREVNFRSSVRVIGSLAFVNCVSLPSVRIPDGLESLGDSAFGNCVSLAEVIVSKTAKLSSLGNAIFVGDSGLTSFTLEGGSAYLAVADGILYDKAMRELKLVPEGYSGAVDVPDGVVKIGDYAFSALQNVTSVDLSGVEEIGTGAFCDFACEDIQLGSDVRRIGDEAFAGSDIALRALPAGVEYIGASAFEGCANLAAGTLVLPESLTWLGEKAFKDTAGITGVQFNSVLTEIPAGLFDGSADLSEIDFANIAEIGDEAFANCTSLTAVVLPDTVKDLGLGVFQGSTALVSATLPDGLSALPAFTFFGCTSLRTVTLPDSVTEIGERAFYGCGALTSFDFENITAAGIESFVGTNLTELSAPVLKTVGSAAFAGVSLTSVSLPEATEIYSYAFRDSVTLTDFSAPKLETLGAYALAGTGISAFSSDTLKTAGAYAFADNGNLTSVSLPALTTLGDRAFSGTRITSFEVGASLLPEDPDLQTESGLVSTAFVGASRLREFTVAEGNGVFEAVEGVLYRHLTVDDGTVAFEYLELISYPAYRDEAAYTVADDTLRIAPYAFYDASYLEEVTLPATLQSIGASAFEGCTYLYKVTFLSAQAPALEGEYDGTDGTAYKNFVGGIGSVPDLTAEIPSNATGYDTRVWTSYFAEFVRSDTASPTQNTMYLVALIDTIPDAVTESDRALVEQCRTLYNSYDSTQQGFVTNIARLEAAEDALGIDADDPGTTPDDSTDSTDSTDNQGGTSSSDGGSGCGSALGVSVLVLFALAACGTVVLKSRREK